MNSSSNDALGNFGFLLDFKQFLLFELAQLAESSVYTNPPLCAVNIRQLTENFINLVLSDFPDAVSIIRTKGKEFEKEPTLTEKQRGLTYFFNAQFQPAYCKKVFPRYPGTDDWFNRPKCPEGAGDKEDKNTLYVWNFIIYLGNIGAHAVLNDDKKRWLTPEYLLEALKQLCVRLQIYFYGRERNDKLTYSDGHFDENKLPISNRQIFYSQGAERRYVEKFDVLPAYMETEYVSVIPRFFEEKWKSEENRFVLVRRFDKDKDFQKDRNFQIYLLRAQAAYRQLQRFRHTPEAARFSVLVDLQRDCDYYVTAYEFDTKPFPLNEESFRSLGISQNPRKILEFCLQLAVCLMTMEMAEVYHRSLKRESVRICGQDDGSFLIQLIDLELCKLFGTAGEGGESPSATVMPYVNAQDRRYGEEPGHDNMSREDCADRHIRDLGRVFEEIIKICPDIKQHPFGEKFVGLIAGMTGGNAPAQRFVSMGDVVEALRNLEEMS